VGIWRKIHTLPNWEDYWKLQVRGESQKPIEISKGKYEPKLEFQEGMEDGIQTQKSFVGGV